MEIRVKIYPDHPLKIDLLHETVPFVLLLKFS